MTSKVRHPICQKTSVFDRLACKDIWIPEDGRASRVSSGRSGRRTSERLPVLDRMYVMYI